jgi:hypothetical protein
VRESWAGGAAQPARFGARQPPWPAASDRARRTGRDGAAPASARTSRLDLPHPIALGAPAAMVPRV